MWEAFAVLFMIEAEFLIGGRVPLLRATGNYRFYGSMSAGKVPALLA